MSRVKRIIGLVLIILAILIVVAFLAIAATRWWTVDDESDILGTWQNETSSLTVEVTDEKIKLSDDVICGYSLNTADKSIDLKLDTKKGRSHYVFSPDRNELLIIDEDLDFFSSFSLDLTDAFKTIFSGQASMSNAGYLNSDIPSEKIARLKRQT